MRKLTCGQYPAGVEAQQVGLLGEAVPGEVLGLPRVGQEDGPAPQLLQDVPGVLHAALLNKVLVHAALVQVPGRLQATWANQKRA